MTKNRCLGESRQSRVDWSVSTRHCASCGVDLTSKKIVGSGSFKDGIFCSLNCYTIFNSSEIIRRHSRYKEGNVEPE